jgi:hypothetical protein
MSVLFRVNGKQSSLSFDDHAMFRVVPQPDSPDPHAEDVHPNPSGLTPTSRRRFAS